MDQTRFYVLAIPLNRPEIVDFLLPPQPMPRGARLLTVAQRPSLAAQDQWLSQLRTRATPTVVDLLQIDNPRHHLVAMTTDRLVPIQFLREDGFLTRNLGGWLPIFFGVAGLPNPWPSDPLLDQAEVLAEYGAHIRAFGADPMQVSMRRSNEFGLEETALAAAFLRLQEERPLLDALTPTGMADYAARVYAEIADGAYFGADNEPPVPPPILLDELMNWLVQLELARRAADARDDQKTVDAITVWQKTQADATGLHLILKGEYIVGRHRRSTVLIAPELGVVVKQPGPEPYHEIELAARQRNGKDENWPYLTHDQSLVTPRGRIRQVLEEGLIPWLHHILDHPMDFYSLLGITVEPFVVGPTTQELVQADPEALTPELYETYILHQQVCEVLGVENGDWHSANFVVREKDGQIVHIDWGAARPLREDEYTPAGRRARLNQVQNIAYSFHDETLAEQTLQLHADLMADEERLARIRRRAEELAA